MRFESGIIYLTNKVDELIKLLGTFESPLELLTIIFGALIGITLVVWGMSLFSDIAITYKIQNKLETLEEIKRTMK